MSFFSNIFSNDKLKEPLDISSVSVDMHSHLVPGIDDGCETMEEAISLTRHMKEIGYRKLIITPHIIADVFPNTKEKIEQAFLKYKTAINEAGIPMQLEFAAEYLADSEFAKTINTAELLSFGNNNVLIELSAYGPPENLFHMIFDLKNRGYNPILAHPERYIYWHYNFEHYTSLYDREIQFQINFPSLSGYYGPDVKRIAEQLISNNMVDFIGSDLHNYVYLKQLEKSRYSKHLKMLLDSGKLLNNKL